MFWTSSKFLFSLCNYTVLVYQSFSLKTTDLDGCKLWGNCVNCFSNGQIQTVLFECVLVFNIFLYVKCLTTLSVSQYIGTNYRVTDNYEHEEEYHTLVRNDSCVPDLCNNTPTCMKSTITFPCPLIHRDYRCVCVCINVLHRGVKFVAGCSQRHFMRHCTYKNKCRPIIYKCCHQLRL